MKCFLKYIVTLILVSAVLFFGIASVSLHTPKAGPISCYLNEEHSAPQQPEGFFSQNDIFPLFGLGNERTNFSESGQTFPGAALNSLSNSTRISYLQQVHHQLYNSGNILYLLQLAFKQLNGYYLYHLCKLLI